MKILLIGADGQLGCDLARVIPAADLIPLTIKDLNITDREQVNDVLARRTPQIVINTAAYHRVDDCEEHISEAFSVNAFGVKYLADACRKYSATLVHISTDYVFDGDQQTPYTEEDRPNPRSVYGISKLAGEFCIKYLLEKYFIVRSAGLYGQAGCLGKGGGNFVENMLKRAETQREFKVVKDEVLSPTYTLDLARKIYGLIKTNHYGFYHIVNQGQCSWYEFAVKVFELAGKKVKVMPVTSAEFKTKARRPHYSALANAGLKKIGLDDLRSWPEALKAYLEDRQ